MFIIALFLVGGNRVLNKSHLLIATKVLGDQRWPCRAQPVLDLLVPSDLGATSPLGLHSGRTA